MGREMSLISSVTVRWQAPYHLATAQTPKGKRVTGKMPGTAVRNNTYRRGDFVTWQLRGKEAYRHPSKLRCWYPILLNG